MYYLTQTPIPVQTVEPVTEPVTIYEARRQVSISETDTTHDALLLQKITSAREQFEKDTGFYFIKRTMSVKLDRICELQFPHRPVTAITSITYYDLSNVSQTLSSSAYQLDTARSQLRLAYLQSWPSYIDRWDAVTITYTLGNDIDSTTVPGYAKSAMLLLIANEFEQRDMMSPDYTQNQKAYERLVAKNMRSTYP